MRIERRQLYELQLGDTFRFCGEANEHIELVKKWLKDKSSVSQEELKANADGVNTLINEIDDVGCVGYEDRSGCYHEAPAGTDVLAINFLNGE